MCVEGGRGGPAHGPTWMGKLIKTKKNDIQTYVFLPNHITAHEIFHPSQ